MLKFIGFILLVSLTGCMTLQNNMTSCRDMCGKQGTRQYILETSRDENKVACACTQPAGE